MFEAGIGEITGISKATVLWKRACLKGQSEDFKPCFHQNIFVPCTVRLWLRKFVLALKTAILSQVLALEHKYSSILAFAGLLNPRSI